MADEPTTEQIREHLEELAAEGLVERHPTQPDNYRLTEAGKARARELEGEEPSMEKHYLDLMRLAAAADGSRDPRAPVHPIDGGRRRPR